jgi:hypothetical protein
MANEWNENAIVGACLPYYLLDTLPDALFTLASLEKIEYTQTSSCVENLIALLVVNIFCD